MEENNKIHDAETSQAQEEKDAEGKKAKIPTELIMIFLIGLLFGIAIKTEFSKRINVVDTAFYGKQGYDLVEMQEKQAIQNQAPEPEAQPQQ